MRIAITIQHPAHVHFFRNVVSRLTAEGHDVAVYARASELVRYLLSRYEVPAEVLVDPAESRLGLLTTQLRYERRLLDRVRRRRPDVVTAIGGLAASHVGRLTGTPSVVFTDSELWTNRLMKPFADVICTPVHFDVDYGAKHRRYPGFHELAYLHPNWFDPDPALLRSHGVASDERYAVVRLSAMAAHHDVGRAGFSPQGRDALLRTLEGFGPVYVAAEGAEEAARGLPVPPEHFHHLLAFADLVVSDSSTTATEAALLGTPAIRTNSFCGPGDMSNFVELGDRYSLVHSTPDESVARSLSRSILSDPTAADRWRERRQALLEDTIDLVPYVVDQVTAVP